MTGVDCRKVKEGQPGRRAPLGGAGAGGWRPGGGRAGVMVMAGAAEPGGGRRSDDASGAGQVPGPDAISAAIRRGAEVVGPSVVRISHQAGRGGMGSGFVWDPAGHLLTNAHVVRGARDVDVAFPDGRRQAGRVIGADPDFDLAVVAVARTEGLRPVRFADSDAARSGDAVLAVGNPYGLSWTVTFGVISGLERDLPGAEGSVLQGMLQTDAAINPGNSGGPLALLDGRVLGVNTAMLAGGQGLGFAIPGNVALGVAEQLRDRGRAAHPWVGIVGHGEVLPADWVRLFGLPADRGVLVLEVLAGTPAARAGLRAFDLIVAVDGRAVASPSAFSRALGAAAGRAVTVRVLRGGEPLDVRMRAEERPGVRT